MSSEKKYADEDLGEVTLRKSRQARRISIRVIPVKGIVVTIPYWVPYKIGEAFLASRRSWAIEARERMEARVIKALEKPETSESPGTMGNSGKEGNSSTIGTEYTDLSARIEAWRKEAKATLPGRLEELAGRYGFSYNRVTIKHNRSNWGSCSAKGNINLNLNLVRLPQELQDYVILHELCHLRHMDHGTSFHRLLEELCRREGLGGSEENVSGPAQVHELLRKKLKAYILL